MYCIYVQSIWLQVQDPFVFRPLQISACFLHAEREPGRGERVDRGDHVASRELVPRAPVLAGAQGDGSGGEGVWQPGRAPYVPAGAVVLRLGPAQRHSLLRAGLSFCLTWALPTAKQTICFGRGVCDVPWARDGRPPEAREGCPELVFGVSLSHFPLLKWSREARLVCVTGDRSN